MIKNNFLFELKVNEFKKSHLLSFWSWSAEEIAQKLNI